MNATKLAPLPLSLVCEMARNLPCAPWLLPRLLAQLANPKATTEQIEGLIRLDAGLASETLRLANSAYFNQTSPCDTFAEAVVRLGFREIYRLATTKIVSRWLTNEVRGYGWQPGDLYRHSVTVAIAADLLAHKTGAVDRELAYTGGLLHDVGKLALAYSAAEHFDAIRQRQAETGRPWREVEHDMLGYDHTEVGATLLRGWSFPANLVDVVGTYPRPEKSAAENRSLVVHVHAAKHVALMIGTGVGEEGYTTELSEAELRAARFDPALFDSLLPAVAEGANKILGPPSSA